MQSPASVDPQLKKVVMEHKEKGPWLSIALLVLCKYTKKSIQSLIIDNKNSISTIKHKISILTFEINTYNLQLSLSLTTFASLNVSCT